jgi:hypothetical protein
MAPLTEAELAQVSAVSPLQTKYGATVDSASAHEIITARLAAAREAAAAAAAAAGASTTTPVGAPMTAAQQQREIARQAREQARQIERERKEAERERKAAERERKAAERQRQQTINTGVRTAGRVITSRVGQSVLRGVFDTIFGGGRGR